MTQTIYITIKCIQCNATYEGYRTYDHIPTSGICYEVCPRCMLRSLEASPP